MYSPQSGIPSRLNVSAGCTMNRNIFFGRSIARNLGYASPQHLAAQFRKAYGTTASAWRRMASSR